MRFLLSILLVIVIGGPVVSHANPMLERRLDEILGSLRDRKLAELLQEKRETLLLSFDVWCREQINCDPNLLTPAALLDLSNLIESDFAYELLLMGKVTLAIKQLKDETLAKKLLLQREDLFKSFVSWCALNLNCSSNTSIEVIQQFIYSYLSNPPATGVSTTKLSAGSPVLPTPYWDCSEFENNVDNTVRYGWFYWRDARIFLDPDKARRMQGPLVYFWHGSNENWEQIYRVLGQSVIDEVVSQGGIVVAPHAGAPSALPWYMLNPSTAGLANDFYVADQIVACAEQLYDIDETRIYSMGFSAGGLQSAAMARMRSNYIAAIASYSGGQLPWYSLFFSQASDNYYKAYISYGDEEKDTVPLIRFADTSENLVSYLEWRGFHEVRVCQHYGGHVMPYKIRRQGWNFIKDWRYSRLNAEERADLKDAVIIRSQPSDCY